MNQTAREAFEAEITEPRTPAGTRRCAHLLRNIASRGGEITAHDLNRLYPDMEPHEQVVAFVMDTRLPADVSMPIPEK